MLEFIEYKEPYRLAVWRIFNKFNQKFRLIILLLFIKSGIYSNFYRSDFTKNDMKNIYASDIVFEVGTNIGNLTLLLASVAKTIYSFEPNPTVYKFASIRLQKYKNIRLFNVGLSSHESKSFMNFIWDFSSANSLFDAVHQVKDGIISPSYSKKVEVQLTTIDKIVETTGTIPNVLVLDCEASEYNVLLGAKNTLPFIERIFVETHTFKEDGKIYDTKYKIHKFLEDMGYTVSETLEHGNMLRYYGVRNLIAK